MSTQVHSKDMTRKGRAAAVKDPVAMAMKRERAASQARAREAIAIRVRARFERDMKVLEACEALFAPSVDIETLENSGAILRQQDYKDCVKERNLRGICGYPLCSKAPSETESRGSKFIVVLNQPRVFHDKVSNRVSSIFYDLVYPECSS